MVGGTSPAARRAFASSLLEPFTGPDAEIMLPSGLKALDDGVAGYTFDLAPLRTAPESKRALDPAAATADADADSLVFSLIQTSLAPLPLCKPRLVNSTEGPHEMLRYITHVGVDVFDAGWAQRLAGWGVALDFEFPASPSTTSSQGCSAGGRSRPVGHNLYDKTYVFDFGSIADCSCACPACSPLVTSEQDQLRHGGDSASHTRIAPAAVSSAGGEAHTRAYIHHLLHTHEMGAHTLLAMHNLTVLDRFFEGVRAVLGACGDGEGHGMTRWAEHVARFCEVYDEARSREVVERARRDWEDVDRARGKGRLAREKESELHN